MNTYSPLAPLPFAAPTVTGLSHGEQELLEKLVKVWMAKRGRNDLRQRYMDAKQIVANLGISIPDYMANSLEIVSGWPEKAVHTLANMCMWDGVVSKDGAEDPFEIKSLLHQNRFDVEIGQTIAAEMTHSVAFIATLPGDQLLGEPEVNIMPYSAQWASALWDRRRRAIKAGLLITETDDLGRPTALILLTPTTVHHIEHHSGGWGISKTQDHTLRRVPMEALPFRPTLDRPFGRSRISRAVMTITDRAIRAALRMDIASELYTAPGLLLRGISKEAFEDIRDSWTWRLGSVKGLTRDEEGEIPEVSTLPQQSMQPYVEQMRSLAAEFAGVTSLPLSSLGVIHDNPSSADAIYAAKEELVIEATNANRVNGYALQRIYQNAVMLRDGIGEVNGELAGLSTRWRNPAMPSVVSQSDALVKQISAIPVLAETDVALEEMGYTDEQITRIRAQIRRSKFTEKLNDFTQPTTQDLIEENPGGE